MQNQLPLFLPYEHVRNLPIVQKYETLFAQLDLAHIPEFNYSVGADGASQHALIRAFLIRSLESLKTVPALIGFLQANPALICLCGFRNQHIPDNSQFYRYLKNKNKKIKRNPKATLGYYSYVPSTDPGTKKKSFSFFWGYRSHAIVDAASGLAIVEATYPNNMPDEKIARKLYKKLKRLYRPKKGLIAIGDKAYDVRDFYAFLVKDIKAEPIIPINPRNTQPDINLSQNGLRICSAGLEMIPQGIFKDGNRLRLKQRCPLKASKRIAAKYPNGCPCNNPKFNRYGCTAYQDLTDDARSRVQRGTPRFENLYAKRFVVEQTFSRLQELKIEQARHYALTAIRNANTIDYLALALVALAAVKLKKPEKIRCFRTFMKAA